LVDVAVYGARQVAAEHLHRLAQPAQRKLDLHSQAEAEPRRPVFSGGQRADQVRGAVFIIFLRADGKEGRVAHEHFVPRMRQQIGTVFALGASAVVQLGVQLVCVGQEGTQQEVRRGRTRRARRIRRKAACGDTDGDGRLVERLLVRHCELVGDVAVPIDAVAV